MIKYKFAMWGTKAGINTIAFYRPNDMTAPGVTNPGLYPETGADEFKKSDAEAPAGCATDGSDGDGDGDGGDTTEPDHTADNAKALQLATEAESAAEDATNELGLALAKLASAGVSA